jgi:hypothetical protein
MNFCVAPLMTFEFGFSIELSLDLEVNVFKSSPRGLVRPLSSCDVSHLLSASVGNICLLCGGGCRKVS